MPIHTAVQGDTIAKLAKLKDVPSKVIWDDAKNKSDLRGGELKRTDPNLLLPGDPVEVPDLTIKKDSGGTEKKHKFKLADELCVLKIKLLDGNHKAHANMKFEILIDGVKVPTSGGPTETVTTATTNGSGEIEVKNLRPESGVATLMYEGRTVELNIGWLDPIETSSGVLGRLQNLGYYRIEMTDPLPVVPEADPELVAAVKAFQTQYVYTTESDRDKITGTVDEKTRTKLKEIHGS
jgi:hypothetical protein